MKPKICFESYGACVTQGCALLFISHKFEEIFSLADRYAVFRDGTSVGSGMIAATGNEQLIRLMVGRSVEQLFPKLETTLGEELLRVENLSRAREFDKVSFSVRQGETLGIYGLVGAGRTELAQCLFGLTAPDAGSIFIAGQQVSIGSPSEAVSRGLAYVPEDRQQQGAILPFSIASNVALTEPEHACTARHLQPATRVRVGESLDHGTRHQSDRA